MGELLKGGEEDKGGRAGGGVLQSPLHCWSEMRAQGNVDAREPSSSRVTRTQIVKTPFLLTQISKEFISFTMQLHVRTYMMS